MCGCGVVEGNRTLAAAAPCYHEPVAEPIAAVDLSGGYRVTVDASWKRSE